MRHSMTAAVAVMSVLLGSARANAQAGGRINFDGGRGSAAGRIIGSILEGAIDIAIPRGIEISGQYGYPQGGYWNWEQVKRLAHEVNENAEHVHNAAEARAHHGDRDEERALSDLHGLKEAAEHFHDQVERYGQSPSHTRSDYYTVLNAYNRARSSIRWSHVEGHVIRDFNDLSRSLNELSYYYRDASYGGGHGRDDDRDDDRDDHDRGGRDHGRRRPRYGYPY